MSCPPEDDPSTPDDPIVGKWQYSESFRDGVKIEVKDCDLKETLSFGPEGRFIHETLKDENTDGFCELNEILDGTWKNQGNKYTIVTPNDTETYTIFFESNKFSYEEDVEEDGVTYIDRYVYIKS